MNWLNGNTCSSCGKPAGKGARCAWCGVKRRRVTPLVWTSLLLVLLLLGIVWFKSIGSAGATVTSQTLQTLEEGIAVEMTGTVVAVRSPPEGSRAPHVLELQDADGTFAVIYWNAVARHLIPAPECGQQFSVNGVVNRYKDRAELKLLHSSNMQRIPSSGAD